MKSIPLAELLNIHVRYELDMLFGLYEQLQRPASNAVCGNALIESFCLHARQLIDFFDNQQGLHAEQFTSSGYEPLPHQTLGITPTVKRKLNTQIAHLTEQRTDDSDAKIGPRDRTQLRDGLQKALRHFEAHLKSPFREAWGTYSIPVARDTGQPSATNAVTFASTGQSTSSTIMANSISVNRAISKG